MPTVLRASGIAIRIYTNDHEPARVHDVSGGGLAKIELTDLSLVAVYRLKNQEVRAAMEIVEANREFLLKRWDEIHGGKP